MATIRVMLRQLPLDERASAALRALLRRQGVRHAYLFGSAARGETGPLSDVDIAILYGRDHLPGDLWTAVGAIAENASVILARRADVTPLDESPVTLRYAVVQEGIVILSEDESERVQFEWRTVMDYLDTEHLRAIQRHYLYEHIRRAVRAPAP